MERYNYFSLVRRADGKEVYTSPEYNVTKDILDIARIGKTLQFYFDRVNSGIMLQLESPKLTDEQKTALVMISPKDYDIRYVQNKELGCLFQKTYWSKPASDWLH